MRYAKSADQLIMGTFGEIIAMARKKKLLSQKELAARIRKEDGHPISAQYLNDIERGRRNPPPETLIRQLAGELGLDKDPLCFMAGILPRDLQFLILQAQPKRVREACRAFRGRFERKNRKYAARA